MNFPKIKLYAWRIYQFLIFGLQSKSKWRIHSPFVYHLTTKVFPRQFSPVGAEIENIRLEYLNNQQVIEVQDFGAGYDNQKKDVILKTLSQVTKSSARKRKEGELLYRMVLYHKPKKFLELGTNLGFSTAYIASALKEIYSDDYEFISVEGSKELQSYANQLLKNIRCTVKLVNSHFDDFLSSSSELRFDAIFIDGNHTYEATIRYFECLKNRVSEGGWIIFDDIYWSPSMKRAWNKIIEDPIVTLSIDLYDFGVVYINKNQAKEHFKVWY